MTSAEAINLAASPMTDEEVIERVLAGDNSLYEVIMRRYNQRLYRVARSILGDHSEAEDVMQDAYVRAYVHLHQFDGRARFATWLTKIAAHEALRRARERQRFIEVDALGESIDAVSMLESKTPSPEQEVLTRTLSVVLEASIEKLPQAYRSVFVIREIEGMSTSEAAECLGLSEEAVKVRLHRARALLRKEIYTNTRAATSAAFHFAGERCDRMVAAVLESIRQ